MKTRLLKKVRKRYTIRRYSEGFYIGDDFNVGDWILVIDTHSEYRFSTHEVINDFQVKYEEALESLVKMIIEDYIHLGIRRKKKITKPEILWYTTNTKTKTT